MTRRQGVELNPSQRRQVFVFLELGKLINNYYDDGSSPLPASNYRKLRRMLFEGELKGDQFSFFFKSVALLEKGRPNPWNNDGSTAADIENYRNKTNLIYLAAACASAGIAPI